MYSCASQVSNRTRVGTVARIDRFQRDLERLASVLVCLPDHRRRREAGCRCDQQLGRAELPREVGGPVEGLARLG